MEQLSSFIESSGFVEAPGMQIVAFFVLWAILGLPMVALGAIAGGWRPLQPLETQQKLLFLALLYPTAWLLLWGIARVTGQSLPDYGLSPNASFWIALVFGWILALISTAVLYGIQRGAGWIEWSESLSLTTFKNVLPGFLPVAGIALAVSATEELVFRGFVQQQLQSVAPLVPAAAIASLLFALGHLIWGAKDAIAQLPGLWLLGMVLTLARIVGGGELGLAVGLHGGWIWAIAILETRGLPEPTGRAPAWVTGDTARPLTGVATGLMLLAVAGLLAIVYHLK
ncbi:MAG: CPBP family intramembrane glutamic endopeptidase [Limnospira sp.]